MLRASVTIATWNRREILEKVLGALANQTMPQSEYEIIICDSNSTDGSKEAILDFAARQDNRRLVEVDLNNPAAKRNEGIRAAQSNTIILLDDDVIPDANFVASHVRAQDATEGTVWCGQVRYPETWIEQSNYFRYRDSRHLGPNRPEVISSDLPPWMITTMNLSFKRNELISRVGLFSEDFLRYGGEDIELGFRIAAGGMSLAYLPEAFGTHYEYHGSIRKYYRKLYISTRDSAPVLCALVPEFLQSTRTGRLEQFFAGGSLHALLFRSVARICTLGWAVKCAIRLLEVSDRLHFLYFPGAYFYLTAVATLAGIRDRSRALKTSAWFESTLGA
jgi:glycosyltransferase involved in cell wall biosynthesis